jgi:predicted SPOUT superfamily RNA methylase MTH1
MEMGMTSTARTTNLQMKQHGFLAMDYYPYNRKIMKACGLNRLPNRRTFDRRLEKISINIKERISIMENMFQKNCRSLHCFCG